VSARVKIIKYLAYTVPLHAQNITIIIQIVLTFVRRWGLSGECGTCAYYDL